MIKIDGWSPPPLWELDRENRPVKFKKFSSAIESLAQNAAWLIQNKEAGAKYLLLLDATDFSGSKSRAFKQTVASCQKILSIREKEFPNLSQERWAVLKFGKERIAIPKNLLFAYSSKFQKDKSWSKRLLDIEEPGIKLEQCSSFAQYLKTQEIVLTDSNVLSILHLALENEVHDLEILCLEFLSRHLTWATFEAAYAFAFDHNSESLRWICLGFAARQIQMGNTEQTNQLQKHPDLCKIAHLVAKRRLKLCFLSGMRAVEFTKETDKSAWSFIKALNRFVSVEFVKIDGFLPDRNWIDSEDLKPLSSLKRLECHNSDLTNIITPSSATSLIDIYCDNCPKLESITSWAQRVEIRRCSVDSLCLPTVEEFTAFHCEKVVSLELPNVRIATFESCFSLIKLDAPLLTKITGKNLPVFADFNTQLITKVSLCLCPKLAVLNLSNAVTIILDKCQNIKVIKADRAKEVIISSCSSLESLLVYYALRIRCTDCPNLFRVDFHLVKDCYLEKCERLNVTLDLPYATCVQCITCQITGLEVPMAEDVSISDCHWIRKIFLPSAITVVCENTSLRSIIASKALRISCTNNHSLENVHGPQAVEVYFDSCSHIQNASFSKAVKAHFSHCDRLYAICLPVARNCTVTKNRQLEILYTPKIKREQNSEWQSPLDIDTQLRYAAKEGFVDKCVQLLQLGADPERLDEHNHSSLFYLSNEQRKQLSKNRLGLTKLIHELSLSPAELLASRVIILNQASLNPDMQKLASKMGRIEIFNDLYKLPGIKPLMDLAKLASLGLHGLSGYKGENCDYSRDESQKLSICLDAAKTSVVGMQYWGKEGLKGKQALGSYISHENKIFIGAKSTPDNPPDEIYSTIIHELTHFIVYEVFENEGKPYQAYLSGGAYDKICSQIQNSLTDKDKTIKAVFNRELYNQEEVHCELIVRVPEMIVVYKGNEGVSRLKAQVPMLLEYYCNNFLEHIEEHVRYLTQKALGNVPLDLFFHANGIEVLENEFAQLKI